MSSRSPQPENFDSTAKLMLEALAKASAELEKSVTAFTEQLISFNESVQKSLDEELHAVGARMEGCLKSNLDELGHSKHVMMKRLLEAERNELDSLSDAGRQVRAALKLHAERIEEKIERSIEGQVQSLKDFLQHPEAQINKSAAQRRQELQAHQSEGGGRIKDKQEEFCRQLAAKVTELERAVKMETEKSRDAVAAVSELWTNALKSERDSYCADLTKTAEQTRADLTAADDQGSAALTETEEQDKAIVEKVGNEWTQQIDSHCQSFNTLVTSLSSVLRENFETKLTNVSEQARQEITVLSSQAREKIAATRHELEVELHDMEKEYVHQLETTLRKLEAMVLEPANDKRNSGVARQHNSQKLRDQMQTHLKRFGASLVDSIKDASSSLEHQFERATDGFHVRIEGARTSAIEHLERESRLMQKEIERTLKEFQRELNDEEAQISKIEHAGQDAVVTVIACRKAMLSFKGE